MKERLTRAGVLAAGIFVAYLFYRNVEFIRLGGVMMVLIVFCSLICVAVIFEKAWLFSKTATDVEGLLKEIFESIERQRIKEALEFCDRKDTPVARVLKAGIMKHERQKEEVKEAMEEAFLYEEPMGEEATRVLAALVQVAPLLGFMGTLAGMMEVLRGIQARGAVVMGEVAGGLWQALVCAMAGFLVAIPALAAHHYFTHKAASRVREMEKAATAFLNFLMEKRMPL